MQRLLIVHDYGRDFVVFSLLARRCYNYMKMNLRHSAPLEMCFCTESFFAKAKILRFWPKTMDRGFDRNRGHCLRSLYSLLEGDMKLRFVPFCST